MPDALSPQAAARDAGLRYISDAAPGIRRLGVSPDFEYRCPDGTQICDEVTLERIRSLVIPPAWTQVWISPVERGHIQAIGRDARGRKQYRYHSRWREVRDESKFDHILAFASVLPRLRRRVAVDLARRGLTREKVLAAVVHLLEATLIRVGNEVYARMNRSFGLTTLRNRHARVRGGDVEFRFVGKSGRKHVISTNDPRLARIEAMALSRPPPKQHDLSVLRMEPTVGFEPTTDGLQNRCSTTELCRRFPPPD